MCVTFLFTTRGIPQIYYGQDAMPSPATVEIGGNSNIPPRIKKRLIGNQILVSQIPDLADVTAAAGQVHVQLPGKTAGVWTL